MFKGTYDVYVGTDSSSEDSPDAIVDYHRSFSRHLAGVGMDQSNGNSLPNETRLVADFHNFPYADEHNGPDSPEPNKIYILPSTGTTPRPSMLQGVQTHTVQPTYDLAPKKISAADDLLLGPSRPLAIHSTNYTSGSSHINRGEYTSDVAENADVPSETTKAVRIKAAAKMGGCWTCRLASFSMGVFVSTDTDVAHYRIRRKRCDEKPDKDNQCQTCVRLHLQCLGFGTKRPEWLRVRYYYIDVFGIMTIITSSL
jgi:hypothetical protein